jgi:2-isopropylmalate synthase
VLTARSGRAALKHRLELLGYQPTKPELDLIYENFVIMADEKKKVENEDLIALVGQMAVFTK